jgi:hypothetical protein
MNAAMKAPNGDAQQFGSGVQVRLGTEEIVMAHVGREPREPGLEVDTLAIPKGKAVNGEGMAHVVGPRPHSPL